MSEELAWPYSLIIAHVEEISKNISKKDVRKDKVLFKFIDYLGEALFDIDKKTREAAAGHANTKRINDSLTTQLDILKGRLDVVNYDKRSLKKDLELTQAKLQLTLASIDNLHSMTEFMTRLRPVGQTDEPPLPNTEDR